MQPPSERIRLGTALVLSMLLHTALLLPLMPWLSVRLSSNPPGTLVAVRLSPTASESEPSEPPAPKVSASQLPHASSADPAPPGSMDSERYYRRDELTRPPRPVTEIDLKVPEAGLLTQSGTVVLTLWIDAQGRVSAYQIEAQGLPEEYLSAVAERFVAAQFEPGEILGRKVASILRVEIQHEIAQ